MKKTVKIKKKKARTKSSENKEKSTSMILFGVFFAFSSILLLIYVFYVKILNLS